MTELTDENFEKEILNSSMPVLVDFFATWCSPCSILAPILEKIAEDLKEKIILIKVDLDNIPLTAQKFGIDRIPAVALFKSGKPVSGFIGLRAEGDIKEWLENVINPVRDYESKEKTQSPQVSNEVKENEKSVINPLSTSAGMQENPACAGRIEELINWHTNYAKKNGFNLNPDKEIVERIMRGLLENEKTHGQKYCPCRRVTGNQEVDSKNICPCYYHREELEKYGNCLCGLFIK